MRIYEDLGNGRHTFSQVPAIVPLHTKSTRALTFENNMRQGLGSASGMSMSGRSEMRSNYSGGTGQLSAGTGTGTGHDSPYTTPGGYTTQEGGYTTHDEQVYVCMYVCVCVVYVMKSDTCDAFIPKPREVVLALDLDAGDCLPSFAQLVRAMKGRNSAPAMHRSAKCYLAMVVGINDTEESTEQSREKMAMDRGDDDSSFKDERDRAECNANGNEEEEEETSERGAHAKNGGKRHSRHELLGSRLTFGISAPW